MNLWRVNSNCNDVTDSKHNFKNDYYHELGGNSFMTGGNYVIEGDLFRQVGVAKEICSPKDFASENLVEPLLSYKTHNKMSVSFHEAKYFSDTVSMSALCATKYFLRLSLHAQNASESPSKQRFLCACCAMIFFLYFRRLWHIKKKFFMWSLFENEHRSTI